ncbi:MAG: N-acetylmuramoyl-L-alanine amidase [Clostridia bacterium]|nr:N-acetylmuramoyl-L-alanine amidase [Clostridia bacterium]
MKILLDAGHYGKYNQSPVNPQYYESEVMWRLQGLLQAELLSYGAIVDTTRSDINQNPTVYNRGRMAEGYDLFISLHSNASSSPKTDRVDIYCPIDNRNGSQEFGKTLAQGIADLMGVSYGQTKTKQGVKGEYYGVLRGAMDAHCPMYFLIEHSFHTNEYATNWLLNQQNLAMLAMLEADIIAQKYGLEKPFIKGDVNGNGKLDPRDYILAKRIYFGTYTPTEDELRRCDINGDGKVTARDYLLIKRAVLGSEEIREKRE